MKRPPLDTSLLLEARDAAMPGRKGKFPEQSSRGDEHLCAKCQYYDGDVKDDEGRLICIECAQGLGLIP